MREAEEKASPLCSVVCTTYNHAKFSRASIQSIADQDYPNIEIIVVDDGSTDGNVDIVRDALEKSGRPFTLIAQENTANVPKNINRGLAAAKGEYVSLLSLDDILLPHCISSKIKRMNISPDIAFVGNIYTTEIDDSGQVISSMTSRAGLDKQKFETNADLLEYDFRSIGAFYIQGAVVRFDIVREFGGCDEDLIGDDLVFRTKLLKYMVIRKDLHFEFEQRSGFAYRKHVGNLHRNKFRQVKSIIQWKKRYFDDRKLPERAERLINRFFKESILYGRKDDIINAVSMDQCLKKQLSKFIWSGQYAICSFKARLAKKTRI